MNDELEKLRSGLRATAPRAPEAARERAISEAKAAFERHRQGTEAEARHKGEVRGNAPFARCLRRFTMPLSRLSLAFAGSAAAVVAGIIAYQASVTPDSVSGLHNPNDLHDLSITEEMVLAEMQQVLRKSHLDQVLDKSRYVVSEGELSLSPTPSGVGPVWHLHDFHESRDRFTKFSPNPWNLAAEEPVSTFSLDVDTASYAFLRATLNAGHLPERDALRTEELINYFPYDYAPPETRDPPFATHVSLMPAPWNATARLMHIGIKGYELDRATMPRANLVFLIDTSGSMGKPNKLPLVIRSLNLFLTALAPDDRIAIVTYADSASVVLEPTRISDRNAILTSLESLRAGGSTAGAAGIRQAYRLAEQHKIEDGINRVILATDGDFNVGIADPDELEDFIARKRASGVFLSVLGFGMGNYNDDLMQHLAQSGNGNAAYVDSVLEARKVLLEETASTLATIAKDVKVQVEFNPAMVKEYRLVGYETRRLARGDFRNDRVDAGEIGAGHTVTALYEVTLANAEEGRIPSLRYQAANAKPDAGFSDEFAFLKLRYKLPDAGSSTLITRTVTVDDAFGTVAAAPRDVRFAAAVAAFGELLRGGKYTGEYGYNDVVDLARGARGDDPLGYRSEFIRLVHLAQATADAGGSR